MFGLLLQQLKSFIELSANSSLGQIEKCVTVKGNQCSFPFRYNGILSNVCVPHPNGGSWCSINTNENSDHIDGEENWELCGPSCPSFTFFDTTAPAQESDSAKISFSEYTIIT